MKYGGNICQGHEWCSDDLRRTRDFCVWLLYYVSNCADSRMKVPRHQLSLASWDHFFLSVFSSSEVLGKNASIRNKLPTAACWCREEKEEGVKLTCFMSKATLVPQTNHSQYYSSIEALNLIIESKSLPVELIICPLSYMCCRRERKACNHIVLWILFPFFNVIWYDLWCHIAWWLKFW